MSMVERLTTLAFIGLTAVSVLVGFKFGYTQGHSAGVGFGKATAINPRNPSEELEMACAGLWIGLQNRKHYEQEKIK